MNAPLCPRCKSPLPADAPEGLCPKCLVAAGFESVTCAPPSADPNQAMPAVPRREEFVPPAIAELAGRFPNLEIVDFIGKGGMGAVYKARQPGLDRLVAIKILPSEVGRDPAFADRFSREARALALLGACKHRYGLRFRQERRRAFLHRHGVY